MDSLKALRLNVRKSKYMVISRKRKKPECNICVAGVPLERVSSLCYLGVTITDDLSWSKHVSFTCLRARRLLGYLYRSFRLASRTCVLNLFKSLVLPVMDYCSAVWDPHQLFNIKKLERVLHFAARLVTGQWEESGVVLCEQLGWSSLASRRIYFRLCLCRRILTGESLIPDWSFKPLTGRHSSRNQCNSCPLLQPFAHTNYFKSSFFVGVIPYWNALPETIISCTSNLAFKRYLKKFLVL